MKKNYIVPVIFAILFLTLFAGHVSAYTIEKLNFSNEGDVVIGPGKSEFALDPGQNATQEIIISNRSGMPKIIDISVEDFQGTDDPEETVKFLGDIKGPFSLKDYVKPEINQITLNFGERLRLPIAISIPESAEPGGLYGAVMISASNIPEEGAVQSGAATGKVRVITRVASLFFVRVNGDVQEAGVLSSFKSQKPFYEKGPVSFEITSQNTGNIHLSPYGIMEIKNMLGQTVDERQIDPWFVMPGSTRVREINWNSNFLMGRYTANLSLNRGYNNIVDQKSFSFWVIPWKIMSIALIGLILIVWFLLWVAGHFEFKKKQIISNESKDNVRPFGDNTHNN